MKRDASTRLLQNSIHFRKSLDGGATLGDLSEVVQSSLQPENIVGKLHALVVRRLYHIDFLLEASIQKRRCIHQGDAMPNFDL